jgi:hypothetical protein
MDYFSINFGNFIIPTDELHDFSAGFKPPTRKTWGTFDMYAIWPLNQGRGS